MPWRHIAGSGANLADAQASHEAKISGCGTACTGASVANQWAGWHVSELTEDCEMACTNMDVVNNFAELRRSAVAEDFATCLDHRFEVQTTGHGLGPQHTMERYCTELWGLINFD